MPYGRISGILGERTIRRLINQLSATINKKTPLDKQREVLKQIMSLREEVQAAALINKQHYKEDRETRRPKQVKETSDEPNDEPNLRP